MADISISQIDNNLKKLNINAVENGNHPSTGDNLPENDKCIEKYSFNLNDLYKLALKFYREKEGKALNLSYQDKLRLIAYVQQVNHGKLNLDSLPSLGVLDVIGKDRRDAWHSLGDMSKEAAMYGFVELLDSICPLFTTFIEAQKRDLEEKKNRAVIEEEKKKQEVIKEKEREEQMKKDEEEREIAEQQKRQVQEALNQQTYHQFKAYAEQQYPGNPEQQAVLVRQLQEQHYHQYMQQLLQQQNQAVQTSTPDNAQQISEEDKLDGADSIENGLDMSEDENDDGLPSISPPSMWTRKDIKDFKESIRKEGGDAIIKVGHGETVTVRVPTHDDGTCLFWEFATDSYDIGFGVYFEWTKSQTNQVSVHIQESDDDEGDYDDEDLDEDEDYSEYPSRTDDLERGRSKLLEDKDRPLTTAIVPIYRRDCQDEVYAGSHVYPGQGVYLLKFDNSYSLWRSKTLYYRVYYTR